MPLSPIVPAATYSSSFRIPTELIDALRERRVIPFIGAGFSSSLNLPVWDQLLRQIADDIEDSLPFDVVANYCQNDYLQIAEYYFLKCGGSVGPLRHTISKALSSHPSPLMSGSHVELVNLGAQTIYTTNYDELIEQTFRELHVPVDVVALPQHIAASARNRTQVVKYHGDLRHVQTLVLTESSYYDRLDFESPMDLKFRADLLGKSVLFMGYSFRDVNIRIIWHRLMQVMKDIPQDHRPTSYIVRLNPNPVLEELYNAVGIRSIVLDPNETLSPTDASIAFGEFMYQLAALADAGNVIPGTADRPFLSLLPISLMNNLLSDVLQVVGESPRRRLMPFRSRDKLRQFHELGQLASTRRPVGRIQLELAALLERIVVSGVRGLYTGVASTVAQHFNALDAKGTMAAIAIRVLGTASGREQVLRSGLDWEAVWTHFPVQTEGDRVLSDLASEMEHSEDLDEDGLYLFFAARRIREMAECLHLDEIRDRAQMLMNSATELTPEAADLQIDNRGMPLVQRIVEQIADRSSEQDETSESDDVPF